jgi:aldehyde dehydrogenase (NAD+)
MICHSPIDASVIGQVEEATPQDIAAAIERARQAALQWRLVPAPKRGQLVGSIGEIVRRRKHRGNYLPRRRRTGDVLAVGLK